MTACDGVGGFVSDVVRVPSAPHRAVRGLRCRFNAEAFDDSLFARLGIHCPDRVEQAIARRRAEYLTGRYLASLLLMESGLPTKVDTGAHREPIWPPGWVGSISHSADRAAVYVAPRESVAWLGVDVEPIISETVARSIEMSVVSASELVEMTGAAPDARALTLVFSAKESFFKAVFGAVGAYFDFDSVRWMKADWDAGRFRLELTRTLASGLRKGRVFDGTFQTWDDTILTVIACRI